MLIWPVYVNFTPMEWERGELKEYAKQASLVASDVLMINPIDFAPKNYGGSFYFQKGRVIDRIPFEQEQILIVDVN